MAWSGRVVEVGALKQYLGKVAPGGRRGDIRSWSAASRRRFLKFMAAVDFKSYEQGGRWAFVTLTYIADPGPDRAKRDLKVFKDALRRRGQTLGVWKEEFQERGVVHFHFLLRLNGRSQAELTSFRRWLWPTWERIRGERTRVDVKWCEAKDVARYIAFDQTKGSKAYQFRVPAEWAKSGRWWGAMGIRPSWRARVLTGDELVMARRVLRRYRQANSRRPIKCGRGRSLNGRLWVIGNEAGTLVAAVDRYLARAGP